MAGRRRALPELFAIGAFAGLVALALAYATRQDAGPTNSVHGYPPLPTRTAIFELRANSSQLRIRSRDGKISRDVELALVVDGTPQTLTLSDRDSHPGVNSLSTSVAVPLGDATVKSPRSSCGSIQPSTPCMSP